MRSKMWQLGWIGSLMLPIVVAGCANFSVPMVGMEKPTMTETDLDIPFEKFVLDNGLTLIVHEDHKAPIVAVNIWYHVGSKNEKVGKTGFAHLFEHLMFNGSENYDDDYFKVLNPLGATDLNGTTNNDRTNYFQNVPTTALDTALWMESDRMGHLVGAISQDKLDEQRGVVQNEKRQGENQPYGRVYSTMTKNTYPAGHPYSWTVIGSMEDLNAASLEDVHEWFGQYYGAANAVIAIAGDIDPKTAKQKVEKFFGDIPAGPPVAKHETWIAKRTGTKRQIMEDRVPQARLYKSWNVPNWGSKDAVLLDLATSVLSSGKTSRFYKRLVYDDQIATSVRAYIGPREISGQVGIIASARPDVDLATVEAAIDEELERFIAKGPTRKELKRIKTQERASFIRGVERIGGFGGKSDVLAKCEVYGGSPDAYKTQMRYMAEATPAEVRDAAERWLSDGQYVMEVHPFPEYEVTPSDVDRSSVPVAGAPPNARFPQFERETLSNGLNVVLAQRDAVPVVNFNVIVDAGYAADQHGIPGTASLAMSMMDEGTKSRTALEISDELDMLGARLRAGSSLDTSTVALSALKENLEPSLDIFADVIQNPTFPREDFNRLKKQRLTQIKQEKARPNTLALRVLPRILYGENHAYGNPMTGSGTEDSVKRIDREALIDFHSQWIRPNNATLVVVGDTSMSEIKPMLERALRDWTSASVPTKNLATVAHQPGSSVYLLNRPGAKQSVIIAAHIAPPKGNPDEIAIETMNTILGGDFTARINMNLREDKHWTYGARSRFVSTKGQRPFYVSAPVQADKTKEAMMEIAKELNGILGSREITDDEVTKAKASKTLKLPGRWETGSSVSRSIGQIVTYGLPDDYFQTYADSIRSLTIDQIRAAAQQTIKPRNLVWVVVGNKEMIESGIRELGYGSVYELDADGNVK